MKLRKLILPVILVCAVAGAYASTLVKRAITYTYYANNNPANPAQTVTLDKNCAGAGPGCTFTLVEDGFQYQLYRDLGAGTIAVKQ